MKKFPAILVFFFFSFSIFAQNKYVVSETINKLKKQLASAKDDSTRLVLSKKISHEYLYSYPDSALNYVQQEVLLAKQMKSESALFWAYMDYTPLLLIIGD